MKFALINGDKGEATKGARGFCPSCGAELISRCGDFKVNHWAHKGNRNCDPWLENETDWHRSWKGNFPVDWQEVVHFDGSGEKHIADVKTDEGFVIEFQHSAINPSEIQKREDFYKNMVWVIDGTRLPKDYKRFCKGSKDFFSGLKVKQFSSSIWKNIFSTFFPEECFPKRWLTSSVPVYFDFQGTATLDQLDEKQSLIWVLFPGDLGGWAVVATIRRKDFIEYAITATHLLLAQDIRYFMEKQREREKEQKEFIKWKENQRAAAFQQFWKNPRHGRYRL